MNKQNKKNKYMEWNNKERRKRGKEVGKRKGKSKKPNIDRMYILKDFINSARQGKRKKKI